jgi:hypothetical protein
MKSLFAGVFSLSVISAIVCALPASAQRVDYGGYNGGGGGAVQQQQQVQQSPAPQTGKAGQIQNLLSINGLTPVPCGFGVAKMIFPNLGEVCITAQPGKFESGATYQYDQNSNSINRVGAAVVNNGGTGQATINSGTVVVPVQSQPQIVPVGVATSNQSDEEFAIAAIKKNGMSVAVCTQETAQFYMSGKLVACGSPTTQFSARKYEISR